MSATHPTSFEHLYPLFRRPRRPCKGALLKIQKLLGDFLRRILEDVARMDALVSEMLELSRLETGQTPLHLGPLDPRALVRSVVDRFRPMAAATGVALTGRVAARRAVRQRRLLENRDCVGKFAEQLSSLHTIRRLCSNWCLAYERPRCAHRDRHGARDLVGTPSAHIRTVSTRPIRRARMAGRDWDWRSPSTLCRHTTES